ncbi:type II secretion system protein [Aquincola sp. S2]|uniref:Type II secretion system protein n=1 Tax=Pseudaquabacterium terrae TaxID=2732868 RepID=A0ABX2ER55_9BURK|nr:type II secretion system protein [Aquabacterium terrae]NRF71121.1 type II secretion system protein [Aquabacterium terrae]
MRASSSERGFTLPELVAVLLLTGILAATAMPRLQGWLSVRDDGWRAQLVAALQRAHQSAVGHRRLVCADIGAGEVTLRIAAANPATACSAVLQGSDGTARSADARGGAAAVVSPPGPIYFQPSGRVSSDGAGASVVNRSITIAGQPAIMLVGETGHVE